MTEEQPVNTTESSQAPRPRRKSGFGATLIRILQSRRWLMLPPIGLGVLVVFLMLRGKKEVPQDDVKERAVKVTIHQAKFEPIENKVVGYGAAQPTRTWTAISEVSGRIERIHDALESGNPVQKGDVLLVIDEEDYRLREKQREADLKSAQASLDELKASEAADIKLLALEKELLGVAKSDLARAIRLRDSNAISTSEVDSARSNELLRRQSVQRVENSLSLYPSRIQAAEAKVAMAQSSLSEATRNLARTQIVSPISGVLSGVDIEVGQFVAMNQRLFEIRDNQRVEIEAQISLAQLNQIGAVELGQGEAASSLAWLGKLEAEVISESGSQTFRWRGRPVRLTESIDAQTRTIGVVVEVHNEWATGMARPPERNAAAVASEMINPEGKIRVQENKNELKIGTYCEVRLISGQDQNRIAIPRTAFDGDQVYLVDDEGRLRSRLVSRGASIGDRVVVNSGIEENDQVIVRPPLPAIEGMLVREQ